MESHSLTLHLRNWTVADGIGIPYTFRLHVYHGNINFDGTTDGQGGEVIPASVDLRVYSDKTVTFTMGIYEDGESYTPQADWVYYSRDEWDALDIGFIARLYAWGTMADNQGLATPIPNNWMSALLHAPIKLLATIGQTEIKDSLYCSTVS